MVWFLIFWGVVLFVLMLYKKTAKYLQVAWVLEVH